MSSRSAVLLATLLAAFGALALAVARPPPLPAGTTVVDPRAPYPEGPLVDGEGVFYTEMGADRLLRWDGHAARVIWRRPGCGPTSVARGRGDSLIVLCHLQGLLAVVGRDGATRQIIDHDDNGDTFVTPNASINDRRGGVYFSSSGTFSPSAPATGAVLYLDAAGRLSRVAEQIHYSNGVVLSADGRTLFVAEHLARRILAYDVADDGTLSGRRVFVALDDVAPRQPARGWEAGPDGLAIDQAGDIAMAEYGGGRILIVDGAAHLKAEIRLPERYVTAPAFIDGGRRLFVTAPESLYDPDALGKVYVVKNPLAPGMNCASLSGSAEPSKPCMRSAH